MQCAATFNVSLYCVSSISVSGEVQCVLLLLLCIISVKLCVIGWSDWRETLKEDVSFLGELCGGR